MKVIAVLSVVAAEMAEFSGRRNMIFSGHCALPGAIQAPALGDGQDGTVAGEAPHLSIYKDGFWSVGCRLDAMQLEGDKYGDEAQSYDLGRSANTSIVRYKDILERENQKDMTPQVCFDFCRTVPEMQFFGLVHGRDCYCMHYYRDTAGGSGVCDLPCDGDSSSICGGEHKSSIYQMHSCEGGLEQDVTDAMADLSEVTSAVGEAKGSTEEVAGMMQASGDFLEGLAEATASPLAQEAKVAAGPLTRAAEDLATLEGQMSEASGEGESLQGMDTSSFENRKKAEEALSHSEDLMDAADEALPAAEEWVEKTSPDVELGEGFNNTFVPILRQVEADLERRQSVCTGDLTGSPLVGLSYDACTSVCDSLAPSSSEDHCIAVQYFDFPGEAPLCFMYKALTELTVFDCDYEGDGASEPPAQTEGDAEESPTKKGFLQLHKKKMVRKHKAHKGHHHKKKMVRKHKAHKAVEITEQKHVRVMLSHPSSKYVLGMKFKFHEQFKVGKVEAPSTFCGIRYSSTYGVTPKFFDGMTKLNRCFGSE